MSDFLKKILKEMDDTGEKSELGQHLAEAFDAGLKAAEECRTGVINKLSMPFWGKGQAVEASMVIFVAVWALVKWAESGVHKSMEAAQKNGEGVGPVKKMWDLVEAALRADGEAEAIAAMENIRRQLEDE